MKKIGLLILFIGIVAFVMKDKIITFAQQSTIFKSNTVITKVGEPTDPKPGTGTGTGGAVSCPVPGGIISNNSYQYASTHPGTKGHCYGGYAFSCNCGNNGRRAKAIDVATAGKDVVLPAIEGQVVQWKLITKDYPIAGGEGGGVGNTFEAQAGTDKWYLDILHLQNTALALNQEYPSGTVIAKSVISHAHMTIGKNLQIKPTAGTASDCDPGWLPSDFMCQ